jgi:site-specific DNA recombinase
MSVVAPFLRMIDISLSNLIAAVYCRKSEENEERQVLSLPAQREEAAKLASQYGIKKTVHYEEARSAKISGRRIAFTRMVKDLRSRKINAIVCWKLDRLARNMVEGGITR